MRILVAVIVASALCAQIAEVHAGQSLQRIEGGRLWRAPIGNLDRDRSAPTDYGAGPGLPEALALRAAIVPMAAGPDAHLIGAFGDPFSWPVIPIHTAVLPDGRIIGYGTDQTGLQGALLKYAIWDPVQGVGTAAMSLLNNTTHTDIFCGAIATLPGSGQMLLAGGNLNLPNDWNESIDATSLFDPKLNAMFPQPPMSQKRWYPTLMTLASGELLVLGGRVDKLPVETGAPTPEIYKEGVGWRTLPGATSHDAYGSNEISWYYPRSFQAPNGKVFVLTYSGKMFYVDTSGVGSIAPATAARAAGADSSMPAVMYRPGKMLSLRTPWDNVRNTFGRASTLIDLTSGPAPVIRDVAPIDQLRFYSTLTVLADGKVALIGGSERWNDLINPAYYVSLWDPATEAWTRAAVGQKPRLYHSTALLLPDASLLVGGGGAPGPVNNLNAEIYYPPYLYKTVGSGQLAERPAIVASPAKVMRNRPLALTVGTGAANTIGRVTILRTAASTHNYNADQRFLEPGYTQTGQTVSVNPFGDANTAPPGYYMVFAFNTAGVPSVAKIVQLDDGYVDTYYSRTPDRSGASLLHKARFSGPAYLFTRPDAGVRRVEFWLDNATPGNPGGAATHVENLPPYDFVGTDGAGLAFPVTLAVGTHSLTVRATLVDGTVKPFVSSTFTVQ
ncbi:MAG: galactose oxidase early set domain-containing protein [Methylotetracoccus sp.]